MRDRENGAAPWIGPLRNMDEALSRGDIGAARQAWYVPTEVTR